MIRTVLRVLAVAALVLSACANLWRFTETVSKLAPRESRDLVVWENRLRRVRDELIRNHYTSGDIGYMPGGVLNGRKRTVQEDVRWVQVRYTMIPLNVRQDSLDAAYVIEDFSNWEGPQEIPEGFLKLYDDGHGLILLRRNSPQ